MRSAKQNTMFVDLRCRHLTFRLLHKLTERGGRANAERGNNYTFLLGDADSFISTMRLSSSSIFLLFLTLPLSLLKTHALEIECHNWDYRSDKPSQACLEAINLLLTNPNKPPDPFSNIHWVRRKELIQNTSYALGNFHAQWPNDKYPKCVAGVRPDPGRKGDEDLFSFEDVGDALEDVYIQCMAWGATSGYGRLGMSGTFQAYMHRWGHDNLSDEIDSAA